MVVIVLNKQSAGINGGDRHQRKERTLNAYCGLHYRLSITLNDEELRPTRPLQGTNACPAGAMGVFFAHVGDAEKALRLVQTDDVKLKERIESTVDTLQESRPSSEERNSHVSMLADIAKFVDARRDGK